MVDLITFIQHVTFYPISHKSEKKAFLAYRRLAVTSLNSYAIFTFKDVLLNNEILVLDKKDKSNSDVFILKTISLDKRTEKAAVYILNHICHLANIEGDGRVVKDITTEFSHFIVEDISNKIKAFIKEGFFDEKIINHMLNKKYGKIT